MVESTTVPVSGTARNEWWSLADIISAGKLFPKEENGDTGIGLNIVSTVK